jgi:hypothetical protein
MSLHFKHTFPALAAELEIKLTTANHPTYAAQIANLVVTDRCHCGAAMDAETVCGFALEVVPLEEGDQEAILLCEPFDLVVIAFKDKIVTIELLYRPEVCAVLDELIPVRPQEHRSAAE